MCEFPVHLGDPAECCSDLSESEKDNPLLLEAAVSDNAKYPVRMIPLIWYMDPILYFQKTESAQCSIHPVFNIIPFRAEFKFKKQSLNEKFVNILLLKVGGWKNVFHGYGRKPDILCRKVSNTGRARRNGSDTGRHVTTAEMRNWRRGWELNPHDTVLQTAPLAIRAPRLRLPEIYLRFQ